MADKKFEKQKLDQDDYKKEEKRISIGKVLLGIGATALSVAGIVIKVVTGHDTPSNKA